MNEQVSLTLLFFLFLVPVALSFSILGIHKIVLTILYYRTKSMKSVRPPDPAVWPCVTIQLPVFNETYVVERLVQSVCDLDYPRDRLQIQILDDSTDETTAKCQALVALKQAEGFDISLQHRDNRGGYKAGALRLALPSATGEFIALFDADFVVPSDFLRRTLPYFSDPRIGIVQTRWGFFNERHSILTAIQAFVLNSHFVIEQVVRSRLGLFMNFNGTAGVWRRVAIDDSEGWQTDTLTEDLDLSYRAHLHGWKFVYLPDVVCNSELPPTLAGFKIQQFRWTKGLVSVGVKLTPRILRARVPWWVKADAILHLFEPLNYLLVLLFFTSIWPLSLVTPIEFGLIVLLLSSGWLTVVFAANREVNPHEPLFDILLRFAITTTVFSGMSVLGAVASVEGLFNRQGHFVRTPKYRIESNFGSIAGKLYHAPRYDNFFIMEIIVFLISLITLSSAASPHLLGLLPFALLFSFGLLLLIILQILDTPGEAGLQIISDWVLKRPPNA